MLGQDFVFSMVPESYPNSLSNKICHSIITRKVVIFVSYGEAFEWSSTEVAFARARHLEPVCAIYSGRVPDCGSKGSI